MAEIAHSTPTSEIHELTGSTPPGALVGFTPVATRREVTPLASKDAGLIDLARRVEHLAARCVQTYGRCKRMHQQVEAAHPRPLPPVSNAVFHAYQAEIRPMEERIGLVHLRKVSNRMSGRLSRWIGRLASMEPHTQAGLAAKASASRAVAEQDVFDFHSKRFAEAVIRDVIRLAAAPSPAKLPPRQPEPSREIVETYRTFLDMEFRFLNWETHRTAGPSGGIWLDNPAGDFHGADGPPPSSRAIAVLSMLGLMPDQSAEEWRDIRASAA